MRHAKHPCLRRMELLKLRRSYAIIKYTEKRGGGPYRLDSAGRAAALCLDNRKGAPRRERILLRVERSPGSGMSL